MSVITKNQLLEAGVHFGHNTRRWNPKMSEYIFGERNGIYIIDLDKTVVLLEEAYKALFTIVQNGGKVLFVGTRKQSQGVIREEAVRCDQFYVDHRWLGGTLTNYKTIRRSINRLFEIEKMEEDGTFEVLPKKEVILLKKERDKKLKFFSGIRDMKNLPDAMVVVDPKSEQIAVFEARNKGIPIFALVDTNCDPDEVDYVIPGNDDAIRAIKLVIATLANAVVEAQGGTPIVIDLTEEYPVEDKRGSYNSRRSQGSYYDDKDRKPREYKDRKPVKDDRTKDKKISQPDRDKKKEPVKREETTAAKGTLVQKETTNGKVANLKEDKPKEIIKEKVANPNEGAQKEVVNGPKTETIQEENKK